jgi:phage-related protein
MAKIYPLPLGNNRNSDIEFREELLKKHKTQELIAYDYALDQLTKYGTRINQNWKKDSLKKLDEELYELRSRNVKTLLYFDGNDFYIILHSFLKTTQKTPKKEIDKALKEIKKWKALKELN